MANPWELTDEEIAAIMMASEGYGYEKGRDVGVAAQKKLVEWLLAKGEWFQDGDYIPDMQKPKQVLCIKERYIKSLKKRLGVE